MRTRRLLALAVVLGSLVAPRAQAGCTHLLVDPAGDVAPLPTGGQLPGNTDDQRQVDMHWAELHSTSRTLTATIKVAGLNPESQPMVDHGYEVSFVNQGERFDLVAVFSHTGDWADVWHELTPNAAEGIGTARGVLDRRRGTITITADLSVFTSVATLSGTLTGVSSQTWTGANAPAVAIFPFADDNGDTKRGYRLGAPRCA